MQLTERDREIIRQVSRHRFLRSWQIAALVGDSRQGVLRRLQLLYHHGYLERPRAQIEYYQPGGSRAMVYGIAHRSLEFAPQSLFRLPESTTVKRLFLEHALMVSDIMVALELACRGHTGILQHGSGHGTVGA